MSKEKRVLFGTILGIIIVIMAIVFFNKTIERRKIEKRREIIAEKENSNINKADTKDLKELLNGNISNITNNANNTIIIEEPKRIPIEDENSGILIESGMNDGKKIN